MKEQVKRFNYVIVSEQNGKYFKVEGYSDFVFEKDIVDYKIIL
tara:strand:- start:1825 stop:1953 length:129 start_codon:yes stop_codon:yes gene_type:complete